jgi:hypothetical protein
MMNSVVQAKVEQLLQTGNRKAFEGQKLPGADFTGKCLKSYSFRGASVVQGKFVGADLTYTNFENANLYGADFTDARCYYTSFKEANLAYSKMLARDMMGCTFTMSCKSFEGIITKPGWWYGWLFYALMMQPPTEEAKDKLIELMGVDRYRLLREQYATRGV